MIPRLFDLPAQDWQDLRRLLDDALALPPDQRDAWLSELPPRYRPLHQRLQQLLTLAKDNPGEPGLRTLPPLPGVPLPTVPPPSVGPYRLLRMLGEGGMASVWLADRTDMLQRRLVALKVPHGAWHRSGLAERLQREREILAGLQHPHIARLYDAGVTPQGQPYLALEYIHGEPIDRHAAALPLRQRLELFLQVCDAVAHAHARLVVHRDLKPSNILVDTAGQAKLLDFGVAKLLEPGETADSELTRDLGLALTPDYAAPEQILGQPLGTSADIYALGVLLFQLLTDQRPYRLGGSSRAELQAAARTLSAPRPSEVARLPGLRRALQGDLDTIVGCALRADPTQRYPTANALADDLRRHLAHQPVLARRTSTWELLGKFMRRHRTASAAAATGLLAVLGGSALALWQANEARAQRNAALVARNEAKAEAAAARRAERRADAEADMSRFLVLDVGQAQSDVALVNQLERALAMVRMQYRNEPALQAHLTINVAQTFSWIHRQDLAEKALNEAELLLSTEGDAEGRASVLCLRAFIAARAGRSDEAPASFAQADRLLAGDDRSMAREDCLRFEAAVELEGGNPQRALDLLTRSAQVVRASGRGGRESAAETLKELAHVYMALGRYRESADTARQSAELLHSIGRARTHGLHYARVAQARALRDGGRPLQARQVFDRLSAEDGIEPPVITTTAQHAATLLLLHDPRALPVLRELLARTLALNDHVTARNVRIILARALTQHGHLREAEQVLALAEAALGPQRSQRQLIVRFLLETKAQHALASGSPAAAKHALAELQGVLASVRQVVPDAWRQWHQLHGELALAENDAAHAAVAAEHALQLARVTAISPSGSLPVANALLLRSRARWAMGQADAARVDAAEAATQAADAAGANHPTARKAAALSGRNTGL